MTKKNYNELSYAIIGCAIEVHKQLGPGLLESVYHKCMSEEMRYRKMNFQTELSVPVMYREIVVDTELRSDHLVENLIVVEYKAVEQMIPLYLAQIMTYLKLLKKSKGLLINFNCENISKNVTSIVRPEFALLPED
jgi:GxxExxY protein